MAQPTQSSSPAYGSAHDRTVGTIRAMLEACDASSRLDRNKGHDDGNVSYEVRMSGQHVGFVYVGRDGQVLEWI